MSTQKTLSIIKPDATAKNVIGKILSRFEENGLKIVAARMEKLSQEKAADFYAVHKDRPFFGELIEYITSGPVMITVLEGEDAVNLNRALMGATDPKKADAGTIRAEFGESLSANVVHGSDSPENAQIEINILFPELG